MEVPEPDEQIDTSSIEMQEADVTLPESEPEPPKKPSVNTSKLRDAIRSRATHSGIEIIEAALVSERLLAERYADGRFGRMASRAYRLWQRRLGFRGHEADGTPDYVSLKRLGDKHDFTVRR